MRPLESKNNLDKNNFDVRAEIDKYLSSWKWFLGSVLICGGLAYFYAKTKVNIFNTTALIQVKEDEGASSELAAFQDLSALGIGGSSNNVLDEIEILKSRSLALEAVKKLKLNVAVTRKKGLKTIEDFDQNPFKISVLSNMSDFYELDTVVSIKIKNQHEFGYSFLGDDDLVPKKFGEHLTIGKNKIVLLLDKKFSDLVDDEYKIVFTKTNNILKHIADNLSVNVVQDNSNIIKIEYTDPVKSKSRLLLNTLVDLYNQRTIDDKSEVGKKTDDFISQRLDVVKMELDQIDLSEEQYKSSQQIADISLQSKAFIEDQVYNDKELFEISNKLSMVKYMLQDISKNKTDFNLLPSNIGFENNLQLAQSVESYNTLLLERNRILRNSTSLNPVVKNLNIELSNLRDNIKVSLYNLKSELEISLKSYNEKNKLIESKITTIPKQERQYRSIARRQVIIEELYTYLLQKKEENEISLAVTVPNAKIIDRAYADEKAVAPKKKLIFLGGIIIGLIIPLMFVFLKNEFDVKFHTRKDVEGLLDVPILGDIPLDESGEKVVMRQGSRSSSAEAFRLLRTNLDFMLTNVAESCKTIFVTSTISGEGKTFVSVNTACSLALSGKKVILVGLDLRAPKVTQYLGLPNRKGVTNYLIGKDKESLNEMIFNLEGFENLQVLSSGVVPPNPAELLLSPKIKSMFEVLRSQFDYIVVDTAPVNLVTDTLMLSSHADMFIYVSRADYLDRRLLEVPDNLYKEKRLPNMAVLINGLDHKRAYGYGYGYGGYGYGEDLTVKDSFYKKIIKKIFG